MFIKTPLTKVAYNVLNQPLNQCFQTGISSVIILCLIPIIISFEIDNFSLANHAGKSLCVL